MDPIQLPDLSGIAEMSKADLEALRGQVADNLKAIFEVDDSEVTKDHVQLAKDHQGALNDIDAQIATLTADEDEFRAMREQFETPVEDEVEVVEEETEEAPAAEVETIEETPATEAAPALVNASTVRKTVARSTARPKAPAPSPVPEKAKATISVAPDVPGYAASQELPDMKTLAEAARTLGAGWTAVVIRALVPNLTHGLLAASLVSIAVVLGEYTIASLLNRQVFQTALVVAQKIDPYAAANFTLLSLAFVFTLLLLIGRVARLRDGKASA